MVDAQTQNPATVIHPHFLLYGILVGFIILGVIYASFTPLFENPDESSHLQVIHHFAEHRRLYPPTKPEVRISTGEAMADSLRYHEPPRYYTPPLYHALGALLTNGIQMDDLPTRLIPNPSWDQGWSPQRNNDSQNKNMYVHLPGETWRESPTMRVAYILRWLSIAFGCVTVICTYHIANFIAPNQHTFTLGATALVAFNPQFIAISASVTNDPMIIAVFSLFVLLALRALRDAAQGSRWAVLGALIGVGLLIKQSALLLLPIGGVAILGQGPSGKLPPRRKIIMDGMALGFAALFVGGNWYINNLQYGDMMGMNTHLTSQMQLSHFGLQAIIATFETYWAGFGWALRSTLGWIYLVILGFVIVAATGMFRSILPNGKFHHESMLTRRALGILILTVGLNMISLVRWAIATGAPYGRLLFPSTSAIAILLSWGLAQWRDKHILSITLPIASTMLFVFAALTPLAILHPTFASPHISGALTSNMRPLDLVFENGPTLLGYHITNNEGEDLQFGEKLDITLYWQANAASHIRYNTWIQLSPQDPTQRIAEDDVWLGGTMYPSDLWQTQDIIKQIHHIQIPKQDVPFGLYWMRLGLTTPPNTRAALTNGDEAIHLGPWRIRPNPSGNPTHPVNYQLGNAIHLQGYDITLCDTLAITLTWQAHTAPSADYTVFVHWLDGVGNIVSQQDAPPAAGRYPTSWWLSGDIILDPHNLTPPPDLEEIAYLSIGMYNPQHSERLPIYDQSGGSVPNHALTLQIPVTEIKCP